MEPAPPFCPWTAGPCPRQTWYVQSPSSAALPREEPIRTLARILVVAVPATFLGAWAITVFEAEPSDTRAESRRETSMGKLKTLPQVVHPGDSPAAAKRGHAVLTARFDSPATSGVALLEKRVAGGWRVVSSAEEELRRSARFTVPGSRGTYRAVMLDADGTRSAVTEAARPDWGLVFEDEFDGDTLDTDKWMFRQLGSYNENGSRKCSKSDERAVSVAEGTLRLQVMADPERSSESCYTEHGTLGYYLNGHVATEGIFGFKYGVAAARVKFPQGRGQHGAFWLQRNTEQIPGDPRQSGAEIDIVEFFGDGYPGGGLASFLFYLNEDGENEKVGGVWPKATKQLPPGDAWWRSFHVFSVEWTPEEYVFRVDGREIFRTSEGVSGVEQFLILSLLSSDWELPDLDESTLPTTMEVDWVRVWQRERPQG